jgi:hypothetical protein
MVDQVTPGQDAPPAVQQTPTPPPVAPIQTPDAAVVELQRKMDELEKRQSDKDRMIDDLKATNQTLEARLSQTHPQQSEGSQTMDVQKEASRILEVAQVDPQKAGEELGALIRNTTSKAQSEILQNISPIIEQQAHVSKIKAENQDLIELGLEPSISLRTNQLMQSGKSFKDAADAAVAEARVKVNKLKSNTPQPPTPPPSGSVGEGGANRQPEPTPAPVVETDADEIRKAQEMRRKKGL